MLLWLTSCLLCGLHGIVCSHVCGLPQSVSSLWAGPDLVCVSNSSTSACGRLACPHCWGRQVTLEMQRWELAMVSHWVHSLRQRVVVQLGISQRQKGSRTAGTSIWLLPHPHFLSHELAVMGCHGEWERFNGDPRCQACPQSLSGLTSTN